MRKIRLKPGDNGKPFVTGLFYKDRCLYTAFQFQDGNQGNWNQGGMLQKWGLSTDTLVWQKYYDDVIEPEVLVNDNGIVYFLGTFLNPHSEMWIAVGLDQQGNELWKQYTQFSTALNGNDIRWAVLDKNGNAVAGGMTQNQSDAAVWILNQYGKELRAQRIDLGEGEFINSVAVDSENGIYISGSVYPPGINIPVAVVAKLD